MHDEPAPVRHPVTCTRLVPPARIRSRHLDRVLHDLLRSDHPTAYDWLLLSGTTPFIRLSRPHFLVGGVVMFLLGSVTAEQWSLPHYILGQSMVIFGQLTTHYVNEYADLDADRGVEHRTWFSGGSGVLVEGAIPPRVAIRTAALTSSFTLTLALVLAIEGRPVAALLGALALALSWAYSMPPVRLLGRGWGEVVATVVVIVLVPWMGVATQGAAPPAELVWAMAMLFPIHMAMILVFEIPDLDSDAAAGKLVLAARIGEAATRRMIIAGYLMAALLLGIGLATGGLPPWSGAAALFSVFAVATMRSLRRSQYAWSGALAMVTLGAAAVALLATLSADLRQV